MQAAAQCRTRGGLGHRLPRFPRLIPPVSEFPRTGSPTRAHPWAPGAVQPRVPPVRVAHAVVRAVASTEIILV
ncbi:hypothetical protein SAMN04490356_2834 [Streptomyces melanosporofaciens]|uniref:Uncharacterized protein n=1 Tax=Streptomyces melanosporofaciens TaxID=67327 RepID=A0A1H4PLX9_STRMJ|nr:hypothetical protein SAMN04490356_2834 [Streptomyces melanosporofaciens]